MNRDYFTNIDREGNELDKDIPMRCNDCNRPAYYDYDTEGYHHALRPEQPCFLIESEDRPNDHEHPLMTRLSIYEATQ